MDSFIDWWVIVDVLDPVLAFEPENEREKVFFSKEIMVCSGQAVKWWSVGQERTYFVQRKQYFEALIGWLLLLISWQLAGLTLIVSTYEQGVPGARVVEHRAKADVDVVEPDELSVCVEPCKRTTLFSLVACFIWWWVWCDGIWLQSVELSTKWSSPFGCLSSASSALRFARSFTISTTR